jgi:hypothetical protein
MLQARLLGQFEIRLDHPRRRHAPYMSSCAKVMPQLALRQEDLPLAAVRLRASLESWRVRGDKRYIAAVLDGLGMLAQRQGDHAAASAYFTESLAMQRQMGDKQGIAESLEHIAAFIEEEMLAVRLWSAAHALRQAIGAPVLPVERGSYEHKIERARSRFGVSGFAALWDQGSALPISQVIGEALAEL